MSAYPYAIDDDTTIIRVDDNVTEISGENFNQTRDAIFKIETELGIKPSGTLSNLKEFLGISHNDDGTIKTAALTAVGLVTLPIDNSDVGTNAGILESKLALDYSTSSLYALISNNTTLANAAAIAANNSLTSLNSHIGGGPAANLRHVASHIDINNTPSDTRDPAYVWSGLFDKNGTQRPASTVASALLAINDDLVGHENAITDAHVASAISVDTSNFKEIPATATDVQSAIEALDNTEELSFGTHRATMHSNGVPSEARSYAIDGYGQNIDGYGSSVVSARTVTTYVATSPGTYPVDSVSNGDTIVKFRTPLTSSARRTLDSEFSQVQVGDIIRINYGTGIEGLFTIESIRFIPGLEWAVRIHKNNLLDTSITAIGRIDRPLFDKEIYHAVVAASSNVVPEVLRGGEFLGSVILADPRSAVALGNGFDPNQIDETHYNLYLQLYPDGNPQHKVITLPAVDITGNLGVTPGKYTLESIVQSTNNAFRAAGYNYRFVAFEYSGNFGIALADAINGVSFSVVNGDNTSGTLVPGAYTNNVIGDASGGLYDALGLSKAGYASPAYQSTWTDSTAATMPTKILTPRSRRFYIADGLQRDYLKSNVENFVFDGYWDAEITSKVVSGSNIEITYTVNAGLQTSGLKKGKTIVVQPAISLTDSTYNNGDYGRFIIKDVVYTPACPPATCTTLITVVNGVHGDGSATGSCSEVGFGVRIYFSNDSVTFNLDNVIDSAATGSSFHRLHEILINRNGESFSHERAREVIQSGSATLLDSTNWHITDVSPKLQGFLDPGTQKKYVRFYVLNYNSISGEFDGYIGKRNPSNSNISEVGPITTGRKNVPTRFYDNTNNDYIELKFVEPSAAPGNTILYPRYVDIEVFPTLSTNNEYLFTATVEVNWEPSAGQYIVENIKDKRQIGSVDEFDLTNSAKDYINAGNKYLHTNGIINGFDFVEIDPTDTTLITFTGGKALVNGVVSSVNNCSVKIPQIKYYSDSNPATVNWAICANEKNNLEAILLSDTKLQYFAVNNVTAGSSYYVESVTFEELVSSRKDLTPIAIANITIASLTINSVKDARRFVNQETYNNPLTLSENKFSGTSFLTTEAMSSWIENVSNIKSTIFVDGYIDITSNLTINTKEVGNRFEIDGRGAGVLRFASGIKFTQNSGKIKYKNLKFMFSNISVAMEIPTPSGMGFSTDQPEAEFENCEFVFDTCNTGILVIKNVKFNNCKFSYKQNTTPSPANIVNYVSDTYGRGCVVFREITGGTIENITIENCEFVAAQAASARYPMILGRLLANTVNNINIINNKFVDSVSVVNGAAVVIVDVTNGGSAGGTELTTINNINIEKNVCNTGQGIYITSNVGSATTGTQYGSSICINNGRIVGNICKHIGFLTSSNNSATNRLIISENKCNSIYTCNTNGSYLYGTLNVNPHLGNVTITNNNASYIQIRFCNFQNDGESSKISIISNILNAASTMAPNMVGFAILTEEVPYSDGADVATNVVINGNIIGPGQESGSAYYYVNGINSAAISGVTTINTTIITNNVVDGFTGTGIVSVNKYNSYDYSSSGTIITNNTIYRRSQTITQYISSDGYSIIKDNYLDSTEIGNGSTFTINAYELHYNTILYNKNHITSSIISSCVGEASCKISSLYLYCFNSSTGIISCIGSAAADQYASKIFDYKEAGTACEFRWRIPLTQIIPFGARLLSVSTKYSTSAIPNALATNELLIKAYKSTGLTKQITLAAPDVTLAIGDANFSDIGGVISNGNTYLEFYWNYQYNELMTLKLDDTTITYVY